MKDIAIVLSLGGFRTRDFPPFIISPQPFSLPLVPAAPFTPRIHRHLYLFLSQLYEYTVQFSVNTFRLTVFS